MPATRTTACTFACLLCPPRFPHVIATLHACTRPRGIIPKPHVCTARVSPNLPAQTKAVNGLGPPYKRNGNNNRHANRQTAFRQSLTKLSTNRPPTRPRANLCTFRKSNSGLNICLAQRGHCFCKSWLHGGPENETTSRIGSETTSI